MISFIENEHLLLEGAAGTAVATLIKLQKKLKGKRVVSLSVAGISVWILLNKF